MNMIWIMIELFNALPPSALKRQTLKKGATVFKQNEPTLHLIIVRSGMLHLLRHTDLGQEVIVHRAAPGSLVAEAGLFSPHYHCDCVASEPSEVTLVSTQAIRTKMKSDSLFATSLLSQFASEIMMLRRKLEIIAIHAATDRVFAAVAAGMHTGTVRGLASQIHLSSEATNRALSKLCKTGQLKRVGRGRYTIRND